jgi:Patatin-like phospholipase
MIVSAGMVILMLIRIIAVNGDERFDVACRDADGKLMPIEMSWLRRHLGQLDLSLKVFLAAHAAGAVLLGFVGRNILYEIADHDQIVKLFENAALGVFLAYVFWLFVGLLYYWTFDADTTNPIPREVIFPRVLLFWLKDTWLKDIQMSPPPPLSRWLHWPFRVIARLGKEGYARPENPDYLYEGHRLAFIAIVGLAVLYVYFFSFTAPVPITVPYLANLTRVVALVAVAFTLAGSALGEWPKTAAAIAVKILAITVLAGFLLVIVYFWAADKSAPRGFSVLGSILIFVTGIFWILTSFSFAFDGTRVPIFICSAAGLLFLKSLSGYPGEHYFTAVTQSMPFEAALTPNEILDRRVGDPPKDENADYPPLIVITAEGGGIHSAAWTANVLAELEMTFRQQGTSFHGSILLASGVSGGSVGLLPFLREYTDRPQAFPDPGRNPDGSEKTDTANERLVLSANCSSLQAIAWGLSYYDMLRFLSPLPVPTFSGSVSGRVPSEGLDRSWALERSLSRNVSDKDCGDDPVSLKYAANQTLDETDALTLSDAAEKLRQGTMPAFTFNTTAAETGGRFLLSNYELPSVRQGQKQQVTDILPAESFLHTFGHDNTESPSPKPLLYADLPLATAARLSATFPYVSSASRVPKQVSANGLHFIDGGYYDNDGTASAMEFLYFGLQGSTRLPEPACDALQTQAVRCKADKSKTTSGRRLPILLVEIRNEHDIDGRQSPESFGSQNQPEYSASRGPDFQLVAPLEGFYSAGHESDTFRNRRELCIFEKAFRDRLDIHHMIFDYRNTDDGHSPLSWDLTPNQQKSIECAIDPNTSKCSRYKDQIKKSTVKTVHQLAGEAVAWFKNPAMTKEIDESCQATGLDTLP